MTSAVAPAVTPRARRAWSVVFLLVLSGWLAGLSLAQPALLDPDEPRTALVARLMAERGDWLSPHLPATLSHEYPHDPIEGDLLAYWDKPPLYFWLAAAAMKVLGPTALAARLPAALAYVATVLLVFAAGRFLRRHEGGVRGRYRHGPGAAAAGHGPRGPDGLAPGGADGGDAPGDPAPPGRRAAAVAVGPCALWGRRPGHPGQGARGGRLSRRSAVCVTVVLAGRWRDLLATAAAGRRGSSSRPSRCRGSPTCTCGIRRGDGSSGGYLYEFLIRQHFTRATGTEYEHTRFVPGLLLAIFLGGFLPWTVFLPAAAAGLGREGWRERRTQPAVLLRPGVDSPGAGRLQPLEDATGRTTSCRPSRRSPCWWACTWPGGWSPATMAHSAAWPWTATITAAGVILIAAAGYFVFNRVYLEQYRGYGPIVVSLVYWFGAVLAAGMLILSDLSLAWRHRASPWRAWPRRSPWAPRSSW